MKVQVGVKGVGKGQVNTHSHPHTCVCSVAQLCLTLVNLWTITCHAPLSLGFSRQEY